MCCRYHEEYQGYVSQQLSCDMLSPSSSFATLTAFNPGRNLTEGKVLLLSLY